MRIVMCIVMIIGLTLTPLNLIGGNQLGTVFSAMAFICGVVGLLINKR